MIKFCTTLPSEMGLILAFFKAKISPFFEGSVVQNLIKHQEEKIIFQQNVFYFVKLFESSLLSIPKSQTWDFWENGFFQSAIFTKNTKLQSGITF